MLLLYGGRAGWFRECLYRRWKSLSGIKGRSGSLLAAPANQAALAAQGHAPADTKAFADARQQLSGFNTAQNTNQNAALELTDENIKAGNALWEYIVDVLGTGNLMYKVSNPEKARYAVATLLKRIRKENGTGGAVMPKA